LDSFYKDLESFSTAALWTRQEQALVSEPKSKALPFLWSWKELRPQAMRAAELVGTADAERRVLMLLNPGLEDRIATTNSLFSGLQIVMPGNRLGPTGTHRQPCDSSSKATAATPLSKATRYPCIREIWC
jgi:gentisate 1,2-dioxygenase